MGPGQGAGISRRCDSAADCWWRHLKHVDDATVVYVDLTADAAREAEASIWLNTDEQARCRRFEFPGPRRRFVLCRAALRAILCRQLGCGNDQLVFVTSRHGKPFATVRDLPVPISFNVSHSGRHGLIAFAPSGRVGIDVEERVARRNLDLLVEGVLTEDEQAMLAATRERDRTPMFLKLWTIKEALLKAHGTGFSLDASRVEVPPAVLRGTTTSIYRFPQLPTVQWRVEYLGNEEFAAAIAHEMDSDRRQPIDESGG